MKYLFDIGHPAHVHYFKNCIRILESHGHQIIITARDKEMSLYLLDTYGFRYTCTGKNLSSKFGKLYSIIRNDWIIYKVAKQFRPDVFVSFFLPFPAHVGKLLCRPTIGFTDTENATLSILMTKPFTDIVVTPECYQDRFLKEKKLLFSGYMELCYLHPNYFTPDPSILDLLQLKKNEKYVIMRFVSWGASHDRGHRGLSLEMKKKAVKELSKYARVFISSEGELPEDLKQYQIKIPPERMHDALAFAKLFIGEGATMASECAMLGTPAIYINSLEVGYCTEEEKKYNLVYNFRNSEGILEKAIELLNTPDLKQEWQKRRKRMLFEKINVTAFMVWLIENYPESVRVMKINPEYQKRFK